MTQGITTPATAAWERDLLPTYGTPSVTFVRGEGSALFDEDGNAYLDFLSGLAVTSLGHAHPAVTSAVCRQAGTLTHTSNLFITPPALDVARRLKDVLGWPDGRVFFANSGAEANEAAIKLARRFGLGQDSDKYRVVTLEGSFHGRTLATLEATGQLAKHTPFLPLAGYVDHVPYDDPSALEEAVDERTCAVLLEIIQGEGGVRDVPDEVLVAARDACDRSGALLVADEVQTGMGRTGAWFAWQDSPVVPDVVTVAKALGNGLPIGACIAHGPAAEAFGPGDHASTFGGNPVTSAAAAAVLDTLAAESLVDRCREVGGEFARGLRELVAEAPYAAGVYGRGLLLALELDAPVAAQVATACLERYLVVNAVRENRVRFAPPLTVTEEELALALSVVRAALDEVRASEEAGAAEPAASTDQAAGRTSGAESKETS